MRVRTSGRAFAIAALLSLTALGATATAAQDQPAAFPVPSAADIALLKDVIDIHAHLDPDVSGPFSNQAPRGLDTLEMAQNARDTGMRGFVVKQHYNPTARLAYMTHKAFPDIEVFGMLCLNFTSGGLNPDAVRHFAEMKGGHARIVSMPTWNSENFVHKSPNPDNSFVPLSRDGKLLPEAVAVIKAIAATPIRDSDGHLALATGHISAEEALLVIREARAQGVENIVVTHAMGFPVDMTVDQMKAAAAMGAYIEFAGGFVLGQQPPHSLEQNRDAIRAVGTQNVILSSDAGQINLPTPDTMMAVLAGTMRDLGFSDAELRQMMVENPAKFLGIAPAPTAIAH